MTTIQDLLRGGTVRPITRWGTPVMHAATKPVEKFDDDLHTIIRDMFATMAAADGVGLAATQIGLDIALFVYDCPDADRVRHVGVFCNPKVTLPEGRARNIELEDEGCLSLPGAYQPLGRPNRAICTGQDAFGNEQTVEGTGLLARCLQHETDHLGGTVFGDRLSARLRRKLYCDHEALAHRYPDDWPVTPKRPLGANDEPEV